MASVGFIYCYAESRYAECCYDEYRYAECCFAESHYAECCYDECRYAEHRYAECHFAECHYAECCNDDCRYAECCNDECRYAECYYAECRSAHFDTNYTQNCFIQWNSSFCIILIGAYLCKGKQVLKSYLKIERNRNVCPTLYSYKYQKYLFIVKYYKCGKHLSNVVALYLKCLRAFFDYL